MLTGIENRSYIEPLLFHVLKTNKLGICYESIKIDSMLSSCEKVQGDRFKLFIPYAKQNLTWNVFFDLQCPEMGPDFIFNDHTFLADMDVDTLSIKVPSLAKWNPNDINALLNVVMELLSCYKQHQMQLIQKQTRLHLEYNMLIESAEIKDEDIEMILLPFSSKPTEAKFLINLSVDISQLESRTCKSESDMVKLFVIFSGADWNCIIPELYLSKSLEEIFKKLNMLQIPPFPSDQNLKDYVVNIKRCIANNVNLIVKSAEKRRMYLSTFLALHHKAFLEFDAINSTYISCLFNKRNFYFLLKVEITFKFPSEPPKVQMVSVYHTTSKGEPYVAVINDYPYNMTWDPVNMIKALMKHIYEYVEIFKRN